MLATHCTSLMKFLLFELGDFRSDLLNELRAEAPLRLFEGADQRKGSLMVFH